MAKLSPFLLILILMSCQRQVNINLPLSNLVSAPAQTIATSIERSISETVGTCTFTGSSSPGFMQDLEFKITFSSLIDPLTLTSGDISNIGSGGQTITWTIENCGDDTNFRLVATSAFGDGTITPQLNAGSVLNSSGESNLLSTGVSNTVNFSRGWYQEAYIKAAKPGAHQFGNNDNRRSMDLDQDTLVVPAYADPSNDTTITNGTGYSADSSFTNSGAVYVYKRTGNTWTQEAYFKASNNNDGIQFGSAVAVHKDTLVVGASGDNSSQTTITNGSTSALDIGASQSGAFFVYKRTGTSWTQEAYIKASNSIASRFYGTVVAIHNDTIVTGDPEEDSNQTTITNGTGSSSDTSFNNSGAVYVYRRTGVSWAQEAYIKAVNNDNSGGNGDYFGGNVSIHNDTLAVSARREDSIETTITNGAGASANNTAPFSGAVYIYKRTGVNWTQEAYIKAPKATLFFGENVSLSGDSLAVSHPSDGSNQTTITNGAGTSLDISSPNSGAVYIFIRTGATWAQEAYIKASNNTIADSFGRNISLKGNTLAVGARNEDSNQTTITNGTLLTSNDLKPDSGGVYIFKRTGSTWTHEAYIKAINADASDTFGADLTLSGDTIAVSSPNEDSNQTTITNGESASTDNTNANSGAVYVYRNRSRLFEIHDLAGNVTSNSVTLNWSKTGGTATGYLISYQIGVSAPADCVSGTDINVGDVNTHTEPTLSAATTYSFRVCATDGTLMTNGITITLTTNP